MHVSHPEHAHWPLMRLHYVILKWLYSSISSEILDIVMQKAQQTKTIWINIKIQ